MEKPVIETLPDGSIAVSTFDPGGNEGTITYDPMASYQLAIAILCNQMNSHREQGGPQYPIEAAALAGASGWVEGRNHYVRFVRQDGAFLDCRVAEDIAQKLQLALTADKAKRPM